MHPESNQLGACASSTNVAAFRRVCVVVTSGECEEALAQARPGPDAGDGRADDARCVLEHAALARLVEGEEAVAVGYEIV